MKVIDARVKGSTKIIRLDRSNFITTGGEGSIYAKGRTVYKIYTDIKKVIPYSKIQELSSISDKNVIKPDKMLIDDYDRPIGYTMKKVSNTYILCQLFPKVFRDREKLDNDTVLKLVLRLREMVENIHISNILVVDMNEMNFLVDKRFQSIYSIDVDSYQTRSFPATAIMESIRDRHTKTFSELTDWFSFGIISFQMFVGIHPFKGRHPTIKYPQDKLREMTERMLKNIPVFHQDIKYPRNVLPFDIIPQVYKEWYKAIFFAGKRLAPPTEAVEVIIVPTIIRTVASDKDFDINQIFTYPANIIEYLAIDGIRIVSLKNNDIYFNSRKSSGIQGKHIAITPENNVICGYAKDYKLKLTNVGSEQEVPCNIVAEEIMSYNGRLFVKNVDTISEIEFINMGMNTQVVPKVIANVMENATQIFPGTIIQNMIGRYIISIFPAKGTHYQISIEELDGYKIIDAKYDNKVLFVIGVKKGKYDKFVFKFNDDFSIYSLRKEQNISYCGINFIVLDNGVVVHINESEDLELFSNKKDSTTIKIIDSDTIDGGMKLFKDGTSVLFSKDNKLYRMKMR